MFRVVFQGKSYLVTMPLEPVDHVLLSVATELARRSNLGRTSIVRCGTSPSCVKFQDTSNVLSVD